MTVWPLSCLRKEFLEKICQTRSQRISNQTRSLLWAFRKSVAKFWILWTGESFNCHQCRAVVLTFVSIMSVRLQSNAWFGVILVNVSVLFISSKLMTEILKPRSWKRQVDWVYASASRSRISIIASLWNEFFSCHCAWDPVLSWNLWWQTATLCIGN